MLLFDKADVYDDIDSGIITERQKRIKILNDKGKDEASIHIECYTGGRSENIYVVQAQTINLVNGNRRSGTVN
ncbi:hypothetical protein [Hufsiella ginkgonis]|uniref:Uncharacterized protein n=1 Tax=Hufsiella ginkgonis TaxID=2695274 RepID=A0A7K1XVD8_9SPHI|nr:hypothetical protein [Hufsiella ginkgonis]MXV14942.1 hypothetical protein [Hufsiella ginkgonis]